MACTCGLRWGVDELDPHDPLLGSLARTTRDKAMIKIRETLGYSYSDARWREQVSKYVIDEGHHVLADNKWGKAAALFPNALGYSYSGALDALDGMLQCYNGQAGRPVQIAAYGHSAAGKAMRILAAAGRLELDNPEAPDRLLTGRRIER